MHKNRIIGVILLLIAAGTILYFYQLGLKGVGLSNIFHLIISPLPTTKSPVSSQQNQITSYSAQSQKKQSLATTSPEASSSYLSWISTSEIPYGFTRNQLSPFFGKITINYIIPVYGYGNYTQASIGASGLDAGQSVDVTGWKLSWREGEIYIPQAINIYYPGGLGPSQDIYLSNGMTLNIYSSPPPFGQGTNLRMNECMGYLENNNPFIPPFYQQCPPVSKQDQYAVGSACEDYLLSRQSCSPPPSDLSFASYDYACLRVLEKFNYTSCFDEHHNDPDFLSNEVRVWGEPLYFKMDHDLVYLFDNNGLLVAVYDYVT